MNALSFTGKLLLTVTFFWGSEASIEAQRMAKVCKQVEISVVNKLSPQKIDRRIAFTNRCWLDLTVTDHVDLILSIERHKTEQKAVQSLDAYLNLVALGSGLDGKEQLQVDKLEAKNDWDEVHFCKAGLNHSGFLLLRKGRVTVRAVSRKDEILTEIPNELHAVSRYRWR